jgi:Fe-S-cluster containining protein
MAVKISGFSINGFNAIFLCSHCNHRCCCSPSFWTDLTDKELVNIKEKYHIALEKRHHLNGHCTLLHEDNTGCRLKEDRPLFCKLAPILVTPKNKLAVSIWFYRFCPVATNYSFVGMSNNKFEYKFIGKSQLTIVNKPLSLFLDKKIEEYPPLYETCKEALLELCGEEYYVKMVHLCKAAMVPKITTLGVKSWL